MAKELTPRSSGLHLPQPKKPTIFKKDATITTPKEVKVQICPRFPDRFAFTPPKGWKGEITKDQQARRLEAINA